MKDKHLDEVIQKYSLVLDDVYRHKDGWKIITAQGIKKIILHQRIDISKEVEFCSEDGKRVIVLCTGQIFDSLSNAPFNYTALGESAPENNTWKYPVNVAEKRAESRCVLMLTGLYQEKWRGEEEMDEMVYGQELLTKRKEQTQMALENTNGKIESASKKKTVSYKKKAIDFDPQSVVYPDLKVSQTETINGVVRPKPGVKTAFTNPIIIQESDRPAGEFDKPQSIFDR